MCSCNKKCVGSCSRHKYIVVCYIASARKCEIGMCSRVLQQQIGTSADDYEDELLLLLFLILTYIVVKMLLMNIITLGYIN